MTDWLALIKKASCRKAKTRLKGAMVVYAPAELRIRIQKLMAMVVTKVRPSSSM